VHFWIRSATLAVGLRFEVVLHVLEVSVRCACVCGSRGDETIIVVELAAVRRKWLRNVGAEWLYNEVGISPPLATDFRESVI
jgi:hypothetical protein